jgi:hypothetical protein
MKNWKPATTNIDIHVSLSLSAHNVSANDWYYGILINPKNLFKFLEHLNIINYRPTADTLHLYVHVARIANDKTYFFMFNLTLSLILSFQGWPNLRGVIFNIDEILHF